MLFNCFLREFNLFSDLTFYFVPRNTVFHDFKKVEFSEYLELKNI